MRRLTRFSCALVLALALAVATGCGSSASDGRIRDGGGARDDVDDAADVATTDASEDVTLDTGAPQCVADDDCAGRFADLGPCERSICDKGACARVDAPNFVVCEGDPCSVVSYCEGGVCRGGLPLDCGDGDDCTRDSCDPDQGGCVHAPLDGVRCDDGDPCTRNDLCTAGTCGGAFDEACACEDDADCRVREDGDLCNGTLHCQDGRCDVDPSTVVLCDTTGDSRCLPTTCDPDTGRCAPTPTTDGTPCEDGNLCTRGDACRAGACEGGAYGCAPCDGDAFCGPHDDGNPCNGTLTCVDEECRTDPEKVIRCTSVDPCVAAACDSAVGECVTVERRDGAWCDDGDACTDRTACQSGDCQGRAVDCDDGDACTTDGCDAAGGCTHTPAAGPDCAAPCATIEDCDDEDPCTEDVCEAGGTCSHSTIPTCGCEADADCDDGNPCTTNTCDRAANTCRSADAADGTECAPAVDACHGTNVCRDATCMPGDAIVCDDGIECTADSCNAGTGCVYTQTETCTCETADDCDDGSPCTTDDCDPGTRSCTFTPGPAGVACSDGSVCTDGDACDDAGHCVPGPPLDCVDGDPCSQDVCHAVDGCQHPNAPPQTSCDDGDPCTGPDACDAGDCSPGPRLCEVNCADGIDDEGDGATDCGDDECAADPACRVEGDCRDGVDGDGDGRTDCDDDDCDALPCGPPESACNDGQDDDRDGVTDCDDGDCDAAPACNPEANCRNDADDDFDGATDCDDGDCTADPACNPEANCRDEADDDFDGATDCDDTDCAADAYCRPETLCEDGIDNDFHGDTDCDDADCAAVLACVDVCPGATPIACGALVDGSNVGVPSRVLDGGCAIGSGGSRGWPGGEVVYAFTATQDYGEVTARIAFESGGDHDLFVLDGACDVRSCLAAGVVSASFAATAGETYYVLVDGHAIAPSGAFGLVLECSTQAPESDCGDGVDDDSDGDTDCDDTDCAGDPACAHPTCTVERTVACGDSVAGTTLSGPMRIAGYGAPCEAVDARGPERAYAFTAAEDGAVRARVQPNGGLDFDLFVLEGACEGDACIRDGTLLGPDTVTWTATAGTTYYLVVDGAIDQVGAFTLDVTCGCVDDAFEENDTQFAAAPIDAGAYEDLMLCPSEHDWYAFEACAGAVVSIDALYALAEGNIDGAVFSPSGATLDDAYGSADDLNLSFTATETGTHLLDLQINPDAGFLLGNVYDLTLSIDTTACDATPTLCDAPRAIACGETRSGNTATLTGVTDGYGCSGWDESGGEIVYAFVAPRAVSGASVSVTPTSAGFDPDVFVLGGACDPQFCVDYGNTTATFDAATPGATFYIVVDGGNGTAGTFDLALTCPAPLEDCDNGVDDDSDGATDCADGDCADAPNCVQTCASAWTLTCGDSDPWTTVGAPSAIDAYLGCGGKDAGGPDYVYEITPTDDAHFTVTMVSNTAGVDLDLYVLSAGCRADACEASGIANDDAGEIVSFEAVAGTTYYLVVDGAAGQAGEFELLVECGDPQSMCSGAPAIVCGQTVGGDNSGAPRRAENYACSFWTESGGEVVYAFTATGDLTGARVALVDPNPAATDHDLYLLGDACDVNACQSGDDTITFDAVAGQTYYVVVEGYQGDEGPFEFALACPGGTEICDDALDNDDDGATDCDDGDCAGAAGCATCEPYPIECGFAETYTTAGLSSAVGNYACGGATAAGPDAQYSIQLAEARTVNLTMTPDPVSASLDLYVLEDGCDGASCIAASTTGGAEALSFVAEAGVTYFVVVDGPAGPGAAYSFSATCAPASAALCEAPTAIACGETTSGTNSGGAGLVATYACAALDESGGEVVYAFTPTRDIPGVQATVAGAGGNPDVFVLDDTCDAAGACLAHGDTTATFDAAVGQTYHVVVDSAAASTGDFTLNLSCPVAPANETNCADGLDEDDDSAADCEDLDCEATAACNGDCAAPTLLTCDQDVLGDTSGRLSALNGYGFCASPFENDLSGAETVYTFTPAAPVTAQLAVSAVGWDARILVLTGTCAPESCVAYFDSTGTFAFAAGVTYYIVVDGYQGTTGPYGLSLLCP